MGIYRVSVDARVIPTCDSTRPKVILGMAANEAGGSRVQVHRAQTTPESTFHANVMPIGDSIGPNATLEMAPSEASGSHVHLHRPGAAPASTLNLFPTTSTTLRKANTSRGRVRSSPPSSSPAWGRLTGVRYGPRPRSSPYRGVTFYRRTGRWEAHIWHDGKQVYLGASSTAEQAARAYDRAAIHFRKMAADLNFPFDDYAAELLKLVELTDFELLKMLRKQSAKSGNLYPLYPARIAPQIHTPKLFGFPMYTSQQAAKAGVPLWYFAGGSHR